MTVYGGWESAGLSTPATVHTSLGLMSVPPWAAEGQALPELWAAPSLGDLCPETWTLSKHGAGG